MFLSAAAPEDELRAAHGRCRYLAERPEEIRKLDALVGPFLPFDQSGDLSRQAKDAFRLVKKIRSDLPCVLHTFCFEGLLAPVAAGDAELLHTIRMLASLNDTSLYATFFIS